MTDRQSITANGSEKREEVFIPKEYFYPRNATRRYANRREQAIYEATARVFTPTIIAWWKTGGMPAFSVWQLFDEIRQEYHSIMAGA